ncbi:NEDD8-activating enzyme E1 catalytic subunit [Heterocephalus glaber]|uniref:NEDD8-activating enzyme E1 catalytic subunit n=1 Tax=Heterocephalus glaber TaxID=10181 RepID=G5AVQ6_HETGA|nr:NEDD8-activating enzyme E1 catalytic subunit [Heterocephalus glaber]
MVPAGLPLKRLVRYPLLPLQETEQGHYVYIPFSTSDLYNWKHQNPPFSEKPQALISLLESVFHTHDPTWDDCQQLLQALFTSEERERIQGQAIKSVLGGTEGPLDEQQQARVEAQLPSTCPPWQANSLSGREALRNYRQISLLNYEDGVLDPSSIVPMIDGGTEGFKGNARVILPGMTACIECTLELYPPQVNFPMCTIASMPRLPEHCIEYVRMLQWPKEQPFGELGLVDGQELAVADVTTPQTVLFKLHFT